MQNFFTSLRESQNTIQKIQRFQKRMAMIHTHTPLYICLNDYQSVAFITIKYNTSGQNNKTSGKM